MKQPGTIGYVVINFDGKRASLTNLFRHPRKVVPWRPRQNARCLVLSTHRWLGRENQTDSRVHFKPYKPKGRKSHSVRVLETSHQTGHRNDRDQLRTRCIRQRIHSRCEPVLQIQAWRRDGRWRGQGWMNVGSQELKRAECVLKFTDYFKTTNLYKSFKLRYSCWCIRCFFSIASIN